MLLTLGSFMSTFLTLFICTFYLLGFICSALAILRSRTPQGATAWFIGLITLPFFTVPLFLIFGHSKFYGYFVRRKRLKKTTKGKLFSLKSPSVTGLNFPEELHNLVRTISPLCFPGFTGHNKIKLLIDGQETYFSMLGDLEKAQKYIIFQFYVFRADSIGYKFAEVLMRKARSGIQVNFLYDEIGSVIPKYLIQEMRLSGVIVHHFNSSRGRGRFQINFRNHRKLLIVDGKTAFVGGLNIGDDYLGLWPQLGPWRDTHVRLEGPSVLAAQLIHAADWYWSNHTDLKADWDVEEVEGDANILILPSGPADSKKTCLLSHIAMINSARERLWIANPYLIPPEGLLDSLMLAALRGVDVRIILPSISDTWFVMNASQVYIEKLLDYGVKIFRYRDGFLHQKVILVDHLFAAVGSANFDFRSMFINFEITVIAHEKQFVTDVEVMLIQDFVLSTEISRAEFLNIGFWKKISSRAANLLAPVL